MFARQLVALGLACIPLIGIAAEPLVRIQEGDLPIIISAPHGGTREIPGSKPREGKGLPTGSAGYFTGRDTGTEELALEIATELERVTRRKPSYVIASYHRKFLDCNRPANLAYEDDFAKAVYGEYHGALEKFTRASTTRYGGGLVIDVHGQGTSASTVYRGTKNGTSTALMQKRFGAGIHNGPTSVFGQLKAKGWKVFPEGDGKEQGGFTGGYITQTYGSTTFGTDAIQFEFGADYRSSEEKRKATAKVLVEVLTKVIALYEKRTGE